MFIDSPLIGKGFDNFKYYAYNMLNAWTEVYSHSNWAELLSGTGIIGTAMYYVPFIASVVALVDMLKKLTGNSRKLCALMVTILLVHIIGDIQKISYDKIEALYPCLMATLSTQYFRRILQSDIEKGVRG